MDRSQPEPGPDRRTRLATALVLVLGVLCIYARVGGFEFVRLDDDAYVQRNGVVAGGLSADGVRWAFTEAHSNNWHPLTWLSHMLDVELYGLEPGAHHWSNVVLHAAGSLLLLGLCLRLGLGNAAAFLVAALYAWHPLRVESVAWVSERKDVLASLFAFATLWAYVGFARRGGAARYARVLVLFALGLLAKPMLVTLPVVMLALDLWPLGRLRGSGGGRGTPRTGRVLLEKVPFLALAVASAVVTVLVQRASGAVQGFETIPLVPRLENALWSVLVYPAQTLAPVGLAVGYPHPALDPGTGALHAKAAVALAVLLAVTALAWRVRRRVPWWLTGWLWYLVMLVPVVGVLQVGEQAHADRYATLPTVGLFLALAASLERGLGGPTRRRAVGVGFGAVLLALAVLAHRQTLVWRDTETLFRRSLAVTGGNYQAHLNLGSWLRERGRLEEALVETRAAVAARPDAHEAAYNLGVQEQAAGNLAAAAAAFEAALANDPASADAHNRLAQLAHGRGDQPAALQHFRRAVELAPGRFDLQANLARLLLAMGALVEAREPLEAVMRLAPDALSPQDRRMLARARAADGDAAGAIGLLGRLRRELPADPGPAADLAWLLATTGDEGLRDPDTALGLADGLLAAPGAPRAALLPLRAAALAAAGRLEEAAAVQEAALELAPPARRAEERARLREFRANRALWLDHPWTP